MRPGGTLVVDGGTLTSACDGEMWQGIIVEGNRALRQTGSNQGSVILTDATIENARTAISTHRADDSLWVGTGGIVQATNTLFRNNRRSAEFLTYENHKNNGTVTDNTGFFTRCTFTVDDDNLFAENSTSFLEHISLWEVRGVTFKGCSFRNGVTGATGSARGKAIYTEGAGFVAQRVCPLVIYSPPPCYCEGTSTDTITRCTFTGFFEAVHAANTLGSYDITIDNCDFSHNRTGVTLYAADNARVSFCDFDLSDTVSYCGLELDNSTGYMVESNVFHRQTYTSSPEVRGITVNSSGIAENVIRKNSFSNMNKGTRATGTNASLKVTIVTGLQFECNSYTGDGIDITVNSGTIRRKQGSTTIGADNLFQNTRERSISLTSANNITYYYSNGTSHIPYNPSTGVTLTLATTTNGCASSLCNLLVNPENPKSGLTWTLSQYRSLAEELQTLSDTFRLRGYREVCCVCY